MTIYTLFKQINLTFSEFDRERAWQEAQIYSNDVARWHAYLNHLCVNTLIAEFPDSAKQATSTQIWEMVNGSILKFGETRLALIPSEVIDQAEFDVPQEWVDIPEFAADYYLAVQVMPDDCLIVVWGFATHLQLKEDGVYDQIERSYSLERDELTTDLNALWWSMEWGLQTRAAIEPLESLDAGEAARLLEQLSQPMPYLPRLEVEFAKWAALLVNDNLRQRLYELRVAEAASPQGVVNLGLWFEGIVESGWQKAEELLASSQGNLAWSFRDSLRSFRGGKLDEPATIEQLIAHLKNSQDEEELKIAADRLGNMDTANQKVAHLLPKAVDALTHLLQITQDDNTRWSAAESLWTIDPGNPATGVRKFKDLGIQIVGHAVALMVGILPKGEQKTAILLRLYPMGSKSYLPPKLQLTVLNEQGKIFLKAQARDWDDYIQLKFSGSRQECFSVRISLEDAGITENLDFAI